MTSLIAHIKARIEEIEKRPWTGSEPDPDQVELSTLREILQLVEKEMGAAVKMAVPSYQWKPDPDDLQCTSTARAIDLRRKHDWEMTDVIIFELPANPTKMETT